MTIPIQHVWPSRRPHQVRALANLTSTYQQSGRAQLHWACGVGKTLVGRWYAEDIGADTTLVLVPSLALVAQALAEWQAASPWRFTAIVVCSDRSAADAWRIDPAWWVEHHVQVTTNIRAVADFLRGTPGTPKVVFSTYHSSPVVATAARRVGARFDLAVCDEAHHLAGNPDERFRTVLDEGELRIQRRLFATATPIYASGHDVLSMADVGTFGPGADRLDFAEAIDAGLLADYQVMVIDASENVASLDRGVAVPAALAVAAREGVSRVLSFHSRVATARRFAAAVNGMRLPDGRTVRAEAIAGTDTTAQRRAVLDRLAAGGPDQLTLVASARCLTEGVDIPTVDGVIFADPKDSETDTVQAIGRALRPAPGKTRGLVILPVVVPAGDETEKLASGAFAAVWGVLRALRSVDPRMAAELDRVRTWPAGAPQDPDGDTGGGRQRLVFDVDGVDLSRLVARIVNPAAEDGTWIKMRDAVRDWAARHGHTAMPASTVISGRPVGRWVAGQRRAYAAGGLNTVQVAALTSIPGWAWTWEGAWWNADRAAVIAAAGDRLDLHNPDVAGLRLTHRGDKAGLTVGRWCARQRRAYRDGDMAGWQIERCEAIAGWTWTGGVSDRESRAVDALAEWVEKCGDANVPAGAMWGSTALGAFIEAVRRRAVLGTLALPLAADVELVTPAKHTPGALDWRSGDTRWELHLLALRQFVTRTGGCDVPDRGTETFGGWTCQLYAWSTRQRHLHRHGHLDPRRAELLGQVPGWQWERARKDRVVVGIGARQHGTRLGYAAGCLCEDCTKANAGYEADRQRRRAAGIATTDLVDPAAARGHLRVLEGQVGFRARPTMRDITGLNKKTIDGIINGGQGRIYPEVDVALRALTAERLLAHIADHPSPRDPMPAGPTIALLNELIAAGWPKSWINRELGGTGQALQIGRPDRALVRRETVEAVARLHAAIDGRTPPVRQWRSDLPTLAEILVTNRGVRVAA